MDYVAAMAYVAPAWPLRVAAWINLIHFGVVLHIAIYSNIKQSRNTMTCRKLSSLQIVEKSHGNKTVATFNCCRA